MKKALLAMIVALMTAMSVSAQLKNRYDTENYRRGVELGNEGKLEESLMCFEAELKEHPKNSSAHFWMSTLYLNMNQYEEALTAIDKAMKYTPKRYKEIRGINHALKATILSHLNEWEKAVEQLTLCLYVLPKDEYEHRAVAYRQRGEIYYHKLGQTDLAEQDFAKAEELKLLMRTE